MNIAKIVSITQNGKPWSFTDDKGLQKTMYPHDVAFDDHQGGQTNAMSVPPPYKVGETVGYEINGQTPRGANKLKITRNPKPGQGVVTSPPPADTSNPDLEAAPAPSGREDAWHHPTQFAPQAAHAPVHGATVGMCLKLAGDFLLREDVWKQDTGPRMEAIARELIQIAQRLEKNEPLSTENVPF